MNKFIENLINRYGVLQPIADTLNAAAEAWINCALAGGKILTAGNGGSACDAIKLLKARGCKHIKFMSIIGAPEGVSRVAEEHPDVKVYVSTLDRCLNERGYILPGLGDAGDRIFGTK